MESKNKVWIENAEIKIFQEYLKIRTDHPNVDYSEYSILN